MRNWNMLLILVQYLQEKSLTDNVLKILKLFYDFWPPYMF